MAYRTSHSVTERMLVQRERWPGRYGAKSTPLVSPGQPVASDQPVLRVEYPIAVASSQLYRSPSFEQRSRNTIPARPVVETLTAGLAGRVVKITPRGGVVIESRSTLIRGAVGTGSQVAGVLTLWKPGGNGRKTTFSPDVLLVVPGPIDFAFLHQALVSGVRGVIASSIVARDLEGFLRADIMQLVAYDDLDMVQTYLPPLTLLLTEGLGAFDMSPYLLSLFRRRQGAFALLSGITSLHREIFPELVISLSRQEQQQALHPVSPLMLGARVLVCGGEHDGKTGFIDYFFKRSQVFSPGNRARAVRLKSEDGTALIVPFDFIERIS